MTKNFTVRAALISAGKLFALALIASSSAQSPLQKTGFDVGSNSSSTANTASNARYVVSATFPANTLSNLTLNDAIPAGTRYVAGSLKAPSGATRMWSTDGGANFVTTEPASAPAVTHVRTQSVVATGDKASVSAVPAPPAGAISGGSTGGDGYRVIPFNNKVYTIYHHSQGAVLYCADVATAAACPGYPTGVPLTSGAPFSAAATQFLTAWQYPEYLNRVTGELYFFAMDVPTYRPRVICANLLMNASCGSYLFSAAPVVIGSAIAYGALELDGGATGTRLYAMMYDGSYACFDSAIGGPCIGTNANGIFASGISASLAVSGSGQSIQINTRLYQWFARPGGASIACFDMAINAGCPEPAFPLASTTFGPLFPSANSLGAPDGFCVVWEGNNTCYSLAGTVQAKPNFAAYVAGKGPILSGGGLGTAVLSQGKSYWLDDAASGKYCWDWATNAACAGFATTNGGGYFYEAVVDPDRPNCIWSLGDSGQIRSFDGTTGGSCSARSVTTFISTPPIARCNAPGASTTWSAVTLSGLAAGTEYASAIITIRDSFDAIVPGFNAIPVASFPFSISSIPYSGSTTSLTISVELTGIPNPVPAAYTANPAPFFTTSWNTNEASQMCFDVAVSCSASSPLVNTVSGVLNNIAVNATHQFSSVNRATCPGAQASFEAQPVPVLSAPFALLLPLALGLIGGFRVSRRR